VSAFHPPPLTYAEDQFDVLYSVSVFSHLHPDTHAQWLKELSRVVNPGGYAFLTIEGATAMRRTMTRTVWGRIRMKRWQRSSAMEFASANTKSLHGRRPMRARDLLECSTGVVGSYGNMAMTAAHVRQQWSGLGLDVIAVAEGVIGRRQDVVVLLAS
jgi:SAM-dependent methyltransferase